MKVFLDTSALIKLYHEEEGSGRILGMLSRNIQAIFLSEIALLEFRSALWKKARQKEITATAARNVIACFEQDAAKFQFVRIDSSLLNTAALLLMRHGDKGLRTLDSVQLASALTLKDADCIFLSSDQLLLDFFKKEKLRIAP